MNEGHERGDGGPFLAIGMVLAVVIAWVFVNGLTAWVWFWMYRLIVLEK
jgi:hypothetical protein